MVCDAMADDVGDSRVTLFSNWFATIANEVGDSRVALFSNLFAIARADEVGDSSVTLVSKCVCFSR